MQLFQELFECSSHIVIEMITFWSEYYIYWINMRRQNAKLGSHVMYIWMRQHSCLVYQPYCHAQPHLHLHAEQSICEQQHPHINIMWSPSHMIHDVVKITWSLRCHSPLNIMWYSLWFSLSSCDLPSTNRVKDEDPVSSVFLVCTQFCLCDVILADCWCIANP